MTEPQLYHQNIKDKTMADELEIVKESYINLYKRLEGRQKDIDEIERLEALVKDQAALIGKYLTQSASLKAGVVYEGYVMIPKIITHDQLDSALFDIGTPFPKESKQWCRQLYSAIVKAAQEGEE